MARFAKSIPALGALLLAMAVPGTVGAAFVAFEASGDASAGSIQPQVDAFRTALGGPNNGNAAGPLAGGRREINWDGGGADVATSSGPTLAAFQNIRGATFITTGSGFLQTPLNAPQLTNLNSTYEQTFSAFSPKRIFTAVGSNVTDVTFSVPGTNGATPATVAGFGAIFSDVDAQGSTTMDFFGVDNSLLTSIVAPPGQVADGSLSFFGILGDAGERIARIRITAGNSALGPDDDPARGVDVVAMDDFLFSEPVAVPEPTSLALLGLGLAGAALLNRRRTRRRV